MPEYAILKYIILYNKGNILKDISLNNIKEYNIYLYRLFLSLEFCLKKYARAVSLAEFYTYHLSLHPSLTKEDREIYDLLIADISSTEVSEDIILDLVKSVQQKNSLSALAIAAFEATENISNLAEVRRLSSELLEPTECNKDEWSFVTSDLEELYAQQIKERGFRWRLHSLNTSLGSLRKGDFGFIFARPETGKTTFVASEITYFCGQTEHPIIWFNNEEQGEKVMLRCFQAALGFPLERLISDRKGCQKSFDAITKGNLKIYDGATIHKNEVEDVCASLTPSCIVFDQIDKIEGFKADRNDLELGDIYQWARELAKRYAPVLGICQADGTGEGVKWLTMAHVSNAKTSKQSEADWILGVGRSHDPGYEEVRHLNISKNKLLGDEDTMPERRHDKWDVYLRPTIARYEDIIL